MSQHVNILDFRQVTELIVSFIVYWYYFVLIPVTLYTYTL